MIFIESEDLEESVGMHSFFANTATTATTTITTLTTITIVTQRAKATPPTTTAPTTITSSTTTKMEDCEEERARVTNLRYFTAL
uniref:Uncharacterized protein n=1 Tax=Setaria digitata TaxID=48799 RepID=A0A915Q676_9BILA